MTTMVATVVVTATVVVVVVVVSGRGTSTPHVSIASPSPLVVARTVDSTTHSFTSFDDNTCGRWYEIILMKHANGRKMVENVFLESSHIENRKVLSVILQ